MRSAFPFVFAPNNTCEFANNLYCLDNCRYTCVMFLAQLTSFYTVCCLLRACSSKMPGLMGWKDARHIGGWLIENVGHILAFWCLTPPLEFSRCTQFHAQFSSQWNSPNILCVILKNNFSTSSFNLRCQKVCPRPKMWPQGTNNPQDLYNVCSSLPVLIAWCSGLMRFLECWNSPVVL